MSQPDFFAFCTSLPLLELKAIGELSCVRHYGEGDLVYSPGDQSNELFIVNRGVVEITPEPAVPGSSTLLCRGDIFGETGAFTRTRRDQTARACALLSVQCFPAKELPQLLRRVPSFVLFLCENMARRLFQVRLTEGGCDLVGSLVNFDLITIYQTIARTARTGVLVLNDGRGETMSEFHFENGTPRWGRFRNLLGEEAFWQLFIQPRKAWTFSFSRESPIDVDWTEQKIVTCSADEMLIRAIQMRDEFERVRESMNDETALVKRHQLNFVWPKGNPEEVRPLAEEIWQIIYNQPTSLVDLCARCSVCALRVYETVAEMLRADLVALEAAEQTDNSPVAEPDHVPPEADEPSRSNASAPTPQEIPATADRA
jgi:hypothetical protein